MLVLSRKSQERLVIGESIEITVLGISGNRVKLGIECDRCIPIRRHELQIQREESRDVPLKSLNAAIAASSHDQEVCSAVRGSLRRTSP